MKKRHWFTLFVLSLLVMTAPGTLVETRKMVIPEARSTDTSTLLQFTSSGHVLGFACDAVYVADGSHAYRVEFVGAASTAPVADPAQGEANRAAPLSRVTYPDLWPGVTLTYDAPAGAILRSAYRVEPFADPAAICLRYNVPAQIESDGTLALAYDTGVMRESAPVAWQEIGNTRVPVQVAFTICDPHATRAIRNSQVGFAVGAYDPAYPLFIDPMLTWNTFLGARAWVVGNAIAVDGYGNVYVAGTSNVTWGTPVRPHSGQYDAFVAKLDSSGGLTWSTFLGGGGADYGRAIAVDGSGNIYVKGESTASWQGTNPPVRAYTGSFDAFVAKLNSSGVLTWNTFLGGNGWDDGWYDGNAIAVDGSDVYVTGRSNATWGSPVRAYTGSFDAFVARLNSSGGLTWHTFLGGSGYDRGESVKAGGGNVWVAGSSDASWQGTSAPVRPHSGGYEAFAALLNSGTGGLTWNTFLGGGGYDCGRAIAVDGSNFLYVVGYSDASWGSPARSYTGSLDAFVVKLNGSSGGFIWNTFLGGGGDDYGRAIAVDGSGNIYVTGESTASWQGTDPPVRAYTSSTDAFVARLSGSAGALTWNTFLGGNGYDGVYAIVASGNNVYVAGTSDATWGTPVHAYSAGLNVYAARLNNSGALIWNTFLGGSATDAAYAIAADGSGNVYVAGYSDASWVSYARGYMGGMDAFVAKLDSHGALIWNTFLGGSGDDLGYGIAVDESGNVYVAGISYATWQGTSTPVRAYSGSVDAFVARLDSSGALTWNTFLGGTGFDRGFAIVWGGSDDLYLAGDSDVSWQGTNPPVRPYTGSGDAFAARLNRNTGALVWNTFLGGSSGDEGRAITMDWSGVYVAGTSNATWGSPVRPYQGNGDAFVAKLSKGDGALVWNTFLGGSGTDWGYAVVGAGVYVAGMSNATWGSPVRAYTGNGDAFAARLDVSTGALEWNTFLGGNGNDVGCAITMDEYGNVYVTGPSSATWGAPVRAYTAGRDAFAARLTSSGGLTWNTFIGGSGDDDGYAIAVDANGRVVVAGRSIASWGAPIRDHNGDWDAFVAQLSYRLFLPLVMRQ